MMAQSSSKKVMLVDDDEDFVIQQQMFLKARGFEVVTASTGDQAKKMLSENKPDVAVVDLMMEEMDAGFVLSHHIKKLYPGMPVIMVTAVTSNSGIEFTEDARKEKAWIKADTILSKPVRGEQLVGEIERLTA